MNTKIENQLYLKASDSFGLLELARKSFRDFLEGKGQEAASSYYRARNYLRDAEADCADAFREARRLMGPPPAYSAPEFEKWRSEYLSQFKILAEGQELGALKGELEGDSAVSRHLNVDDIDRLLVEHFEAQRTGKRKLANIKVRLLLARLSELLTEVRGLAKQAREKFQSGV